MKVVPVLIDNLIPFVLGGRFWNDCKQFVQDAEATGLPGDKKKELVANDLRAVFGDVGKFALDLGITLGVLYLKSQHPEWAPLADAIEQRNAEG